MDFEFDARTAELYDTLNDFLLDRVYPAEAVHAEQVAAADDPWTRTPVLADLKAEARRRGLWNLFLPDPRYGAGLTNLQYAPSRS
ncbi:hypothetical protein GCM10027605_21860 [Micromonospora zhanjiangensis]